MAGATKPGSATRSPNAKAAIGVVVFIGNFFVATFFVARFFVAKTALQGLTLTRCYPSDGRRGTHRLARGEPKREPVSGPSLIPATKTTTSPRNQNSLPYLSHHLGSSARLRHDGTRFGQESRA